MTWLSAHWRWIAVAAGLLAAFAVGHFTVPAPDVHETETIATTVQQWSRTQYVHDVVTHTDRVVVTVTKRDGTKTETDHIITDTHEHDQANTEQTTRAQATEQRAVSVTNALPSWRAGLLVGAGLQFSPALNASLEVGAQVDKRIVGPFWVGLWVLARPSGAGLSAGASLSVQF